MINGVDSVVVNVNRPLPLVEVPAGFPLTEMATPTKLSLVAPSLTLPEMVTLCPKAMELIIVIITSMPVKRVNNLCIIKE